MKPTLILTNSEKGNGDLRRIKSKRRAAKFKFHLPRRAQLALLNLPESKLQIETARRVFLVELSNRLIGGGISQNQTARLIGVSESALSGMRATYEKHGSEGLRARRMGRMPRKRGPQPCVLNLVLQP